MAHAVRSDGVRVAPLSFIPRQGPHTGVRCHGVRLLLDPPGDDRTAIATFVARTLRPVTLGLQLLHAVCRLHPHEFAWAPYPTAANPTGQNHLARLVGRSDVAERLVTLLETQRVSTISEWTRVADWPARTAPILLYDRTA